TVGDLTVYEGNSGPAVVTVPVDLSAPTSSTVTVKYTVVGDPTGAGSVPTTTGKLSFPAGVAAKKISVTVTGDTSPQGDGNVQIQLSAPLNAHIEDGVGEVLVRDDDSASTNGVASIGRATSLARTASIADAATIGDATVVEADSGEHY